MRQILGHYREERLKERGLARLGQHVILKLVDLRYKAGLLLLAVLERKESVQTPHIEVLPALERKLRLEFLPRDRVAMISEHIVTELLEDGLEDDFVGHHLLLEELDVVLTFVRAALFAHLFAHVVENCGQIGHEEEGHANVLVCDEDAWKHGRLHDAIEDLCLLVVTALAIDAADEHQCIYADPAALRVKLVMFSVLASLNLGDLLKERFDNRGAQVQILHVLDLALGPRCVPLDALWAVYTLVEVDTDGEIGDERAQQELGLH